MNRPKAQSLLLKGAVYISAALTVGILLLIVGYILIKGLPSLNSGLFSVQYTSENASLFPALINTFTMTIITLLLAVPLGIGAAVYLAEYAPRKNKVVNVIRMTAETLSGIPSIV